MRYKAKKKMRTTPLPLILPRNQINEAMKEIMIYVCYDPINLNLQGRAYHVKILSPWFVLIPIPKCLSETGPVLMITKSVLRICRGLKSRLGKSSHHSPQENRKHDTNGVCSIVCCSIQEVDSLWALGVASSYRDGSGCQSHRTARRPRELHGDMHVMEKWNNQASIGGMQV